MTTRSPKFMQDARSEGATRPASFARELASPGKRNPVLLADALGAQLGRAASAPVRQNVLASDSAATPASPTLFEEPRQAPPTAPAALPAAAPAPAPPRAPDREPRLEAAIASVQALAQKLAEQAQQDALEVGFIIAKRIIEQELQSNPQPLVELIRASIRKMGETRHYEIRVSPHAFEQIEELRRMEVGGLALADVRISPDPALGPADCVIESDHASVDARLSVRLQELALAAEMAFEESL